MSSKQPALSCKQLLSEGPLLDRPARQTAAAKPTSCRQDYWTSLVAQYHDQNLAHSLHPKPVMFLENFAPSINSIYYRYIQIYRLRWIERWETWETWCRISVAAPGQALRRNGLKISWKSAGHCGSGGNRPCRCLEAKDATHQKCLSRSLDALGILVITSSQSSRTAVTLHRWSLWHSSWPTKFLSGFCFQGTSAAWGSTDRHACNQSLTRGAY